MRNVTTTLRAAIASPHRRAIGWFCVYLAVALVATRPLVMSLGSAISYGCEAEATVPLFNLWTLWWNADRAAQGFAGYWTAPIFHPVRGTFAFSEAQPTMMLVAPLVWLTGNRVLAYNVYQLLILTLNGWSGQRLLRRVGHRPWLAFCGGAMGELLPFVWWQLGVVQLTTLFGIIWTIHSLLDLFSTPLAPEERGAGGEGPLLPSVSLESPLTPNPSPQGGEGNKKEEPSPARRHLVWLRLGGAFGLTYWLCNYWGLFLAILLVPASVWLWNRRLLRVAFWREVVLAGLVAGVMILPIASVQRSLSKEHTWSRDAGLIVALSAHARDLTDTPWPPLVPGLEHPEVGRANVWPLGGGGLKLLLLPLGLLAAVTARGRRRWGLFVATLGLIAFGLSLGPNQRFSEIMPPGLAGQSPYEWLQRFVPGFSLIRSPFRFVLFVQLAAVWLSVEALDLLDPRRWKRGTQSAERGMAEDATRSPSTLSPQLLSSALRTPRSAFRSLLVQVPLLVASLIVALEVLPAGQRLYPCSTSRDLPVWVLWLRDSAQSDEPIACLPFPTGYSVGDYEATAVWMYWSTFHRHPLVNGYSGFFPQSFLTIKDGLEQFDRSGVEDEDVDAKPDEPGVIEPQLKRNPPFKPRRARVNASEAEEDDVDAMPDEKGIVPPQLKLYPWHSPGLAKLNASGAVYAVVPRTFATRDDVWAHPATKFRWAWVTGDESAQIDIYRIEPPLAE